MRGIAHDTPILGYRVNTANLLRLWSAEAVNSFDFEAFNTGDYYGAVEEKVASETISKVLYPNDTALRGKQLRLEQQFFLVSCALQDMIRIHLQTAPDASRFHEKYAVQLNDTHPALAVAELTRILLDDHGMDWDSAWDITRQTMGTPTTRCFQRRSRNGRSACSEASCRGTSRSCMRSTADFSTRSGCGGRP
jgi:glycogen phosphorylase